MKLSGGIFTYSIFWVVVTAASLCLSRAAAAITCGSEPQVQVLAVDQTHNELICTSAAKAIDFLASYGLRPQRMITIDVIETLIDNRGYIAIGSYDRRSDRIQLMSLAAIQASSLEPLMYDEPFDEEQYGGAVAHEVAHAVMGHNVTVKQISTSPQEYLAHATQMAVLSEERRKRIIERVDVDSWLPGDSISEVYMAMEPTRFAVKSYLHLTTMDNPLEFITILLNAKWFYVDVP